LKYLIFAVYTWRNEPKCTELNCKNYANAAQFAGADLGFYKGGCPIYLKGAPEVEGQRRREGWSLGRGLCRLSRKCLHFWYQNGEFLCIPSEFIDTV